VEPASDILAHPAYLSAGVVPRDGVLRGTVIVAAATTDLMRSLQRIYDSWSRGAHCRCPRFNLSEAYEDRKSTATVG